VEELDCVLSLSFRLDITTNRLVRILEAAAESTSMSEAAELGVLPPMFLSASDMFSLEQFENLTFEYFSQKFILRVKGNSNDLTRLILHMREKFEKEQYDVEETIRFVELEIEDVAVYGKFLDTIRSKVQIDGLKSLSEIIGEKLHPYAILISGEDLPTTDAWLNIHIQPDPLSPNHVGLLSIMKRTQTLDKMLSFLGSINSLVEKIQESYGEES